MTFQNENLNLAASYLQLYLETRDTHDWIHVMVKAVAMKSFLRALNRDNGRTRILEFWCWCNEGRGTENMLRQHRHMIAVSEHPKGRFEQEIWPDNFSCRRFKKIYTPIDLVNTLGHVSKRQFELPGEAFLRFQTCPWPEKNSREKHFYISKSLPTDFKLALATLWPGGVEQLLYQEKFSIASIPRVVERPMIREGHQWQQKIKDFYKLERGLVIPVEKRFAPTTEMTPYFIHLTRKRKLYFKPSPENENLNQASWLRIQSEGGNSFYDAVGEETWTPHPEDQIRINDMMPLVHWIEYIKADNIQLRRENAELRSENDELKEKLEDLERMKN